MSASPQTVVLDIPMPEPEKRIALIYNSLFAVPAMIDSINEDGTVNLTALIPREHVEIDFENNARNVNWELEEATYLRVIACDPCVVIARRAVKLNEPMIDNEGNTVQSITDQWVVAGRNRMPRLRDMYTSLIGRWFDPALWNYRVRCWRGPWRDRMGEEHPAVEQFYPKKKEIYTEYAKAFQRFYKENFSNQTKWHLVEIQPISKTSPSYVSDTNQVRG